MTTTASTPIPSAPASSSKKSSKKRKRHHASLEFKSRSGVTPPPPLSNPTATTSPSRVRTVTNHADMEEFRRSLPVYAFKEELVQLLTESHSLTTTAVTAVEGPSTTQQQRAQPRPPRVLLISAETGSGKSTQIPAYVMQHSTHRMAVTQPRRVAAITLAQRVALEHKLHLGGPRIGYRVRFDNCSSADTQLLYSTDGMLLREAMLDPLLKRYSIIFLDEAHERSLQTDIVAGVVKKALQDRASSTHHPLQVVCMSATLQQDTFESFFGGPEYCRRITIPGRQYPVQILYTDQPVEDYLEAALSTIVQIHIHEPADGDILVFLPGQEEIEDLALLLRQQLEDLEDEQRQQQQQEQQQFQEHQRQLWTGDQVEVLSGKHDRDFDPNQQHSSKIIAGAMICVLYAALPADIQMQAFTAKPVGCTRKVILATNIAETSVTLPEIRYVVDTGKHKCRNVSRTTGMESLTVETIAQDQALQRAGRAGRVQAGLCFRLYTEEAFWSDMTASSIPEILRVSLAQVVLQLKNMGVVDPTAFDFVTPPDTDSLIRATKLLYALHALNDEMELTEYGKTLAKLPLDPVFGHLLLQSVPYQCLEEMLTAVAALSAEHLFYRPGGGASRIGGSIPSSESTQQHPQSGHIHAKAAAAHRRFASHEGDLPTYVNVYQAWSREAVYVPPSAGGRKAQKKRLKRLQQKQASPEKKKNDTSSYGVRSSWLLHGDWCERNFISGRALARAYSVREQLATFCYMPKDRGGLELTSANTRSTGQQQRPIIRGDSGINKEHKEHGAQLDEHQEDSYERFLKAIAAGLFLQAASRIKHSRIEDGSNDNEGPRHTGQGTSGRSGLLTMYSRGRYRTKVGQEIVSIHPTSTLFHRQPAPACVVYTELVTTKKTYIRGVTQIREEWLEEVAPSFYSKN